VLVAPIWNVPTDVNVHDRVEVPEPVTLVTDNVQEVLLVVRLTTPPKPLTAVTVIIEVPALPAFIVTLAGLVLIVKSWTTNVTVTE